VREVGDRLGYVQHRREPPRYLGAGHLDFGAFFTHWPTSATPGDHFESFSLGVLAPGLTATWRSGQTLGTTARTWPGTARGFIDTQLRASSSALSESPSNGRKTHPERLCRQIWCFCDGNYVCGSDARPRGQSTASAGTSSARPMYRAVFESSLSWHATLPPGTLYRRTSTRRRTSSSTCCRPARPGGGERQGRVANPGDTVRLPRGDLARAVQPGRPRREVLLLGSPAGGCTTCSGRCTTWPEREPGRRGRGGGQARGRLPAAARCRVGPRV